MENKDSESPKQQIQEGQVAVVVPEILGDVQYHYCNHARMGANKWEIRIAFADIGPTGKTEPKTGVVLSHIAAKALSRALASLVKYVEETRGEIVDPDEAKGITNLRDKTEDSEALLSTEEVAKLKKQTKK